MKKSIQKKALDQYQTEINAEGLCKKDLYIQQDQDGKWRLFSTAETGSIQFGIVNE